MCRIPLRLRSIFRRWIEVLADQLATAGLAPEQAARVATTAVAAMEGALILCRTEGSAEPLEAIAGALLTLAE